MTDRISRRAATDSRPDQRYFWGTRQCRTRPPHRPGNERLGFEVKRTATPQATASLRSAIDTLRLDRAVVVHAGTRSFPLPHGVEAVAAHELADRTF